MTLREGPVVSLDDIPVDKKLAICMGCEETGLSEKMHEAADYYVKLPMYGFTDSFNISVSAALALQTLTQKLRKSQTEWRLCEAEQAELRMRWTRRSIKRSAKIIERFLDQRDL
jgi:tRNA (guanosine-2'-O-)-methyltransferase